MGCSTFNEFLFALLAHSWFQILPVDVRLHGLPGMPGLKANRILTITQLEADSSFPPITKLGQEEMTQCLCCARYTPAHMHARMHSQTYTYTHTITHRDTHMHTETHKKDTHTQKRDLGVLYDCENTPRSIKKRNASLEQRRDEKMRNCLSRRYPGSWPVVIKASVSTNSRMDTAWCICCCRKRP